VPLSELRDRRVDAADLLPRLGGVPMEAPAALAGVAAIAARLVGAGPPDPAVRVAARLLADPRARVETVADDVGLSERQLRRRFHAAVGYGPRTLQRVLRFRRVVGRLDAGGRPDLAALAADAGYADQAHLTRECARLAGMPPAALARDRAGERLARAAADGGHARDGGGSAS
jgi:AraC-like DNA-binding protein